MTVCRGCLAPIALLLACSTGRATGGGGAGGRDETPRYVPLVTADWEVDSFSEKTSDVHLTVLDRDVYVGAIRPLAPAGTHHMGLAASYLGEKTTLYGAGIGTNALEFPPGVGLKLSAGTTLILDLHLFNPSMAPLTGTSGVEIVEVRPEDVVEVADVYAPGPVQLSIPPNQETTVTGRCVAATSFTIFAELPHMHRLGTHLRTSVTRGATTTVLYDAPFTFDEQLVHEVGPLSVAPGDWIATDCTFTNPGSEEVHWGASSTDEMCFSILYRYPAQKGSGFCTE